MLIIVLIRFPLKSSLYFQHFKLKCSAYFYETIYIYEKYNNIKISWFQQQQQKIPCVQKYVYQPKKLTISDFIIRLIINSVRIMVFTSM